MLALSEGSAGVATALNSTDSAEFYHLYQAWTDRQQTIVDAYKKKQ